MTARPKSTFARRVRAAKPRDKRDDIRDDAVTGLMLRVFPSGTRTYAIERAVNGRRRYANIGDAEALTVPQARREARRLIAGSLAFTRDPAKGSMADLPGVYCLRTNLMDWDAERLWKTYVTLTDLEAVFRCLKSELGLRPIHHRAPRRTEGHLFIAVLAYQLVQIVRRRLRENGHTESWSALRNRLAPRCRVTATFRCADGRTLHLRKATTVEPHQKPIYDTLGIDPDAGGFVKKVI